MINLPRVGVYICHCGINIASGVDVAAVARFASGLPGVMVARDYTYMCSEPGQAMIKEDIARLHLTQIVVASCSPLMHEPTFRACIAEAGLNPYCLEMANIREQCAWVHAPGEGATQKAMSLVASAVAKAGRLEPLQLRQVSVLPAALVIGGGIAGMQAALDFGEAGFQTTLVERTQALGGHLAQWQRTFPTMQPVSEMLDPLIERVSQHPCIKTLTNSELSGVQGYIGNFTAQVKNGDGNLEIPAGVIVVATGFEAFDAHLKPELGYGVYPLVMTTVDFERLPGGEIKVNGRTPEKVVFIQCVGSRDAVSGNPSCSRVCCMVTAKQAHIVHERLPEAKITVCYMDVRAFGKGFEEFYDDVRQQGIIYRRGNPSEIIQRNGQAVVRFEDTLLGELVELEADLVVLAVGMRPCASTPEVASLLKLARSPDGFFMEAHPKLRPVDTAMAGVFLAGCCQGPKDTADTVAQARAAAATGLIPLLRGNVQVDAATAYIDEEMCSGCGQCAKACSFGALSLHPVRAVMQVNPVLCQGCGACSATCPSGAIDLHQFEFNQVMAQIEELVNPGYFLQPARRPAFAHKTEKASSTWLLKTGGNLEKRLQSFLGGIWGQAKLDGMLIPVYTAENGLPGPMLITSQDALQHADPFIPLMPVNAARTIVQLSAQHPSGRFAAVLRSCEARALAQYLRRTNLSLPNWLIIGIDCLASFPMEDFSWRLKRAGDIHTLTHQVLRNARQGGISADRFRSGCQMCTQPGAQLADVCIAIIGLPTKEYALVSMHNQALASQLALDQITEGPAPSWIIDQHDHILAMMIERHTHVKQRLLDELESSLPQDVEAWIAHLQNCAGCEACLDVCPLYTGQLQQGRDAVAEWLAACVSCGMCEQACPQHLPITALIRRIVENLHEDLTPV